MSSMPTILIRLSILSFLWLPVLTSADEPAVIKVQVASDTGASVLGAKVSVHLWSGAWDESGVAETTNQSGSATLKNLPADQYLTVVVEADGFAPVCQDTELSAGEQRTVTFKLSKPRFGTLRVTGPDGEPIVGVVLSELSYKDSYGNAHFYRHGTIAPFEFEPLPSDANGIIKLPAIPAGAKIKVKTFYKDYLAGDLEVQIRDDGELGVIKLTPGIPIKMKLIAGSGLEEVPENLNVLFYLSPRDEDRATVGGVYQKTVAESGIVKATANEGQYEMFELSSKDTDYTITPMVDWRAQSFKQMLNVPNGVGQHDVEFMVRKNVAVYGRLIGELSGIESARIVGWTENLHPSLPVVETDAWIPVSRDSPQPDGTYKLNLPPGKARVSVSGPTGLAVAPSKVDLTISVDGSIEGGGLTIPDMEISKINAITGTVLNEDRNAIAGAIVRICPGVWGGEYVKTDQHGHFELSPELILETEGYAKVLGVKVVAFDPTSDRAACIQLPTEWRDGKAITISCEPKEPGWLTEQLELHVKESRNQMDALSGQLSAEEQQQRRDKLAAGEVGATPPDLSTGTWLNSKATKLSSFHGKYVLLDFWFIGCGPCKGDLPTVQLCHELFGDNPLGEQLNKRFSVVSVHVTDQSVPNVQQYAEANGMHFPVVVDGFNGEIEEAFEPLGVTGFPSYILLDPQGKILINDVLSDNLNLRSFKVEIVWDLMRSLESKL